MATPLVSGVAALLRSAIPDATYVEVCDALIVTADDLCVPGRLHQSLYG